MKGSLVDYTTWNHDTKSVNHVSELHLSVDYMSITNDLALILRLHEFDFLIFKTSYKGIWLSLQFLIYAFDFSFLPSISSGVWNGGWWLCGVEVENLKPQIHMWYANVGLWLVISRKVKYFTLILGIYFLGLFNYFMHLFCQLSIMFTA